MRLSLAAAAIVLAAACTKPSPQPQPDEMEQVVNGTRVANSVPEVSAGGDTAGEGSITPGEGGDIHAVDPLRPEQVVAQFGDLLEQKRLGDAFGLVDAQALGMTEKQFEHRFSGYETIDTAVGKIGRTEGAAGSLYSEIQLTLSGNRNDGTPYVMTGPVTLRRVNDVPGSTAEQRRWHIVKMELAADPRAAEKLVKR